MIHITNNTGTHVFVLVVLGAAFLSFATFSYLQASSNDPIGECTFIEAQPGSPADYVCAHTGSTYEPGLGFGVLAILTGIALLIYAVEYNSRY